MTIRGFPGVMYVLSPRRIIPCTHTCGWHPWLGFTPEAGCPTHDPDDDRALDRLYVRIPVWRGHGLN